MTTREALGLLRRDFGKQTLIVLKVDEAEEIASLLRALESWRSLGNEKAPVSDRGEEQ